MKLNKLCLALTLITLPLSTMAAGLDRSGQSISAFLQPGNYAEAGLSVLDPTVEGTDNNGNTVSDMGDDYVFASAAVKIQATDKISFGLLYDQPFGADAQYGVDGSDFASTALNEGTSVKVRTNNITALVGYQPTENWNFYAGPVWQTVEADISLRGYAYKGSNYTIQVDQKEAYGWAAGFAYSKPEIALKAAVTYRSEITHNAKSTESSLISGGMNIYSDLQAVTPQSVNIDLQTGVSQNTLVFANLRWVHWDQFVVSPTHLSKDLGQDLISYSDDQYSATIGTSHKFNSKWAATAAVGYDSGAGNPVTTLGPTEGYWSISLGGQYSPAEHYFIQAGVKYFWLGDATAQTGGDTVGEFTNNHAIGYGMKIGYRF
ncbi:OmpP1/FadL family transporter [Acinetobacter faecalis]|uniref:OmpP1/FadL family transporter n=1 Tax=Acinetobacter faecalis TaxID=2665161 RepID=UPI002A9136AB|nr:outer membrane protein transport protein [Acinetobacter faecalis]MDY6529475.1 outer membrane protein transport protein [Acinetobacter faecalis]